MIINKKRIKGLQAYKVKGEQEYLYAWMNNPYGKGIVDAFCNVMSEDTYPSCHSGVSLDYLNESCTPMSQSKLPEHISSHLVAYSTI